MLRSLTDTTLADQLLRIARDPDLRRTVYEQLGDYCHQCRNRLNSLKLSLYLAMRQSPTADAGHWSTIDGHYQDLERRVDRVQTLCRPLTLSRVTLGLDLLIDNRRAAWSRSMASAGRSLVFDPPVDRAVANFDVERMGQALDSLVEWRAGDPSSATEARLSWWVSGGGAHLAWEELQAASSRPTLPRSSEGATWTLPLLSRVVMAHGGDYRVEDDRGWRLEIWWPSVSPTP
jgi:hypothetical protein